MSPPEKSPATPPAASPGALPENSPEIPPASAPSGGPIAIQLEVNRRQVRCAVSPRLLLSDFLRQELGLTGTHVGCEHGVCGACTVIVDGRSVRACLLFAVQCDGASLLTVEGLGSTAALAPLQRLFREHHALQCGFCTPGMLMTVLDVLTHEPLASEREIRDALSGNLCRCTGYAPIVAAVRAAAAARDAGTLELPRLPSGQTGEAPDE